MSYGVIGDQTASIDGQLCSIISPNEIQRTPRSIELIVKFWKGSYAIYFECYSSIDF